MKLFEFLDYILGYRDESGYVASLPSDLPIQLKSGTYVLRKGEIYAIGEIKFSPKNDIFITVSSDCPVLESELIELDDFKDFKNLN